MKKILYFASFLTIALVSSCLDRTEVPAPGGDTLTIDLTYDALQTRSTTPGTEAENAVTSVDYFFYTDTAAAPVFFNRDDNPTVNAGKYTLSLTAGGQMGDKQVPDLGVLFNNKQSYVFAVFNAPSAIAPAKLADLKKLAVNNSFSYDNAEEGEDPAWIVTPDHDPKGHQKYFVMTGEQIVTRSGNATATGTVNMSRLAAKVAVKLQIDSMVNIGTQANPDNWKPLLGGNNVRLYLCNYVQNSVLGAADATPVYPTSYTQTDYTPYLLDTDSPTVSGLQKIIAPQEDFYTYPIEWTPGADSEPFIKVILPWYPVAGTAPSKELYYKIMLPKTITRLEANTYYQLTVNLTLLGKEGQPTIELDADNIQVVGWGDSDKVNPVISAAKYLSVQKDFVKFYTVSSGVSFNASDPASVEIVNVYHTDLKTGSTEYIVKDGALQDVRSDLGTKSWITENGLRVGLKVGDNNWILLNNNANYIQAGHQLDKSLTSTHMDVTPWTYEIKVHLGSTAIDAATYNDESYIRTVIFEQWPEVYVVADKNTNTPATEDRATEGSQGIFVNKVSGSATTWGETEDIRVRTGGGFFPSYEYIRNYEYNLGGANGINPNANNRNPNMYVLTISVSDSYIIGDPRLPNYSVPSFSTGSTNHYATAPSTYNNDQNNRLTYYHPTSSENTANMIAPKIRVASSYGVCTVSMNYSARDGAWFDANNYYGIDEEDAVLRCATYQEDGIPAGRWRLPTMAEVQFISTLSALGRIPYLFGSSQNDGQVAVDSDSYYWTANGLILINNGSSPAKARPVTSDDSPSQRSVRCVYDEWFWGDATSSRPVDKMTFTWGDRNY